MNYMNIVFQSMLARVIEVLDDAQRFEDFTVVVEALEDITECLNQVCIMNILMNKITKLDEITDCMYHFRRYMALNGR